MERDLVKAFPNGFEINESGIVTASKVSVQLLSRLNDDPDSIWLLTIEERLLVLPHLLLNDSLRFVDDRSGILNDYLLMLLTPPDSDTSDQEWWRLIEKLGREKKVAIAEVVKSWEDADDESILAYPGWSDRREYWCEYEQDTLD